MARVSPWPEFGWPISSNGRALPFLMGIIKITKEKGEWTLTNNCWEFCNSEEKILTYCPTTNMIFIAGTVEDRIVFMREFVRQTEFGFFIPGYGARALELGYSVLNEYLPVFSIRKDQ